MHNNNNIYDKIINAQYAWSCVTQQYVSYSHMHCTPALWIVKYNWLHHCMSY